MGTLGQKMHDREAHEAADGMFKLERIARQQGQDAQENLKAVVDFFDAVRQRIIDDISNDIPVQEITLGKTNDGSATVASILNVYSWGDRQRATIEHPEHPYYPVWERFDKWAKAEELKVGFSYNHDGGGRESWQRLNVKVALGKTA